MKRGRFITFEGIDGAGKSTHLSWGADYLRAHGVALTLTREPGGTEVGESLRDLLLTTAGSIHPETEALLMFGARRQHVEDVINPCLARGDWVLCDRFTDASFAYQGAGRGVDVGKLAILEGWVHADLTPDLTILFDVDPEVGRQRVARIKSPDRFERQDADFFNRVREGYLERAKQCPDRMMRLDGAQPVSDIRRELGQIFDRALTKWKT